MSGINAEIITIGDEILIGQILDTNSHWISVELDLLGIKVHKKTSIRDEERAIYEELDSAFKRSDIIIMTGGLGPTKDDITKKTIASYFDVTLKRDEEILKHVKMLYEKRNRKMNDNNIAQADLPENCTALVNHWGTASGMWFEHNGKILISLPGVPMEMKNLLKSEGFPRIKKYFQTPSIRHLTVRTIGIGESDLMSLIEEWEINLPTHIKLAYLPRLGQVRLRLSGVGTNAKELENELESQAQKLESLIPKYVFGRNETEIQNHIGDELKKRKATLSTAESCTGGHLAHLITSVPGSSAYYKGSVISYDNEIKTEELSVDSKSIENHGAVSEEVIGQMAENIRKKYKTDFALASSGIAGPDGGTKDKPVGTIWIALSDENGTVCRKLQLGNDRVTNIKFTSQSLLNLLRKRLKGDI